MATASKSLKHRAPTVEDGDDSDDSLFRTFLSAPIPLDDDTTQAELYPSLGLFSDLDQQIPRLSNITLKTRPLGNHAVDLSCDAELAVAADDSVHVLLPEFPTPDDMPIQDGGDNDKTGKRDLLRRQQYHTFRGQFMAIKKPDPRINRYLFEDAGRPMDLTYDNDQEPYFGVGGGIPTGFGASLNQTVTVKWSPSGLGYNLRPILAVLLTNGSVIMYGEDPKMIPDVSSRRRTFKSWRILWGVGGILPLPDATKSEGAHLPRDKITSIAWAREINRGRALLSYLNDREEIVIIAVRYASIKKEPYPSWNVKEVARFKDLGPHPKLDWMDPDFVPYGTPNALAWSPWLVDGDTMTASLAHTARSYIGFRRITIPVNWERGKDVAVTIEEADYNGLCVNTLINSAIVFEDAIWIKGDKKICLGALVSPFAVSTFETSLNAPDIKSRPAHPSNLCKTTYPAPVDGDDSTNPVSGIYMHPPNVADPRDVPTFTLIRLAATAKTTNWYQRNNPRPDLSGRPQWLDLVQSTVTMSIPRAMASGGADDSDQSDAEGDSSDDDFEMPDDAGEQVRPWRMHLYGIAASPAAAGMSVVLLAQQSTLGPERKYKTKLAFGWRPRRLGQDEDEDTEMARGDGDMRLDPGFRSHSSTEARVWEWMYGGGPAMPFSIAMPDVPTGWQALREHFAAAIEAQKCLFCGGAMVDSGRHSVCERKHSFATCAATGLAIKAPGISRACGICGLRTLCAANIRQAAEEHGAMVTFEESLVESCGGCGGKFIA